MESHIVPRNIKSKRYPNFIRLSNILKIHANQKRVFPKIGLMNSEKGIRKGYFSGCKIVFSGSGNKALWDIATMSERGIESCQSWNNNLSRHLVGSMLDPYCGIIYIENNEKHMLARAVVRFVISVFGDRPALMLERIYVSDLVPWPRVALRPSANAQEAFKDFLKKKVAGKKIPVISCGDKGFSFGKYSIPMSNVVAAIHNYRSYVDSGVPYRHHPKFVDVSSVRIMEKKCIKK